MQWDPKADTWGLDNCKSGAGCTQTSGRSSPQAGRLWRALGPDSFTKAATTISATISDGPGLLFRNRVPSDFRSQFKERVASDPLSGGGHCT